MSYIALGNKTAGCGALQAAKAKKYPGVTISDIKKWNGISGEDLKPGMKLKING